MDMAAVVAEEVHTVTVVTHQVGMTEKEMSVEMAATEL
jgi:hypothetical protein